MGNIRSLTDLLAMIRRRIVLIVTIFLIGSVISFYMAMQKSRSYESTAVLQMEMPRIAGATAAESVTHSGQRMQLLEQQIRSRDSLLALADRHGLFDAIPDLPIGQRLAIMRNSVILDSIRAPHSFNSETAVSAIVIRVVMPDPVTAADMANELASQVLESTNTRKSAVARETLDFFASEERRISGELATLEAEMTAFKNAQIAALPESLSARRQELSQLEEQIRDFDRQIMDLQQELLPLQAVVAPRVVEQRRMTLLESRMEALQSRQKSVDARISDLQESITLTPMVESRLGTYLRRQQQLQDQYSVINRRRAEAETSQRLDSEQQTEHFTLLEAALPPDYAMSSGRRKVMAAGGLASGLLAVGLAFLLELKNPAIRTARQMESVLKIRPVIALPELGPARRRGLLSRLFGRRVPQP
ncbi:Wzz/FepE/Etk N-terminal domain-containing protein [Falsigemmobacter faecalis]|uniref:Polysaccharide chain length determinant N-terminal domain-containing protein n=1 Tax=Falsigemmobacter faecalis TaxID=2488730 RepID=A0A3P3DUG2_9RHOB|nr:Wzz/FepE/Etk N-terminal domain-containing protein [Falsigemmobacter faecalis]RRH77927.1 hypothetical protein EG244_02570 [Falsigemmobacter faecalis]